MKGENYMENMALVNVHELNKVVDVHCRSINILDARREAEELYKAVKLYGYENVKTVHFDESMCPYIRAGKGISEDVRALSAFGVMNLFQMSDSAVSKARLQKHYGDVSFEAVLGARIGASLCLSDKPLVDAMEKYAGIEFDKEAYESVYIQQLFNFVEHSSKSVDLLSLWSQTENLFKGIVTVGLDNVTAWYYNNCSQPYKLFGRDLSEKLRAFCGLIVMFMYGIRTDSTHMLHIQDMLGLSTSISNILGDDYLKECRTLREIANKYLGEPAGTIKAEPLFLQKPFELIELKKFDVDDLRSIENLWTALELLYKNVKMVGADDVKVCFWNENKKKKVVLTGKEIPDRIKAFDEECVIYMYRMCDDSEKRSRLEEDLGLNYPSRYILGDTNVISCKKSMPCVPLRDIARRYLES